MNRFKNELKNFQNLEEKKIFKHFLTFLNPFYVKIDTIGQSLGVYVDRRFLKFPILEVYQFYRPKIVDFFQNE